jgi:type I restriction enzyme S subunit
VPLGEFCEIVAGGRRGLTGKDFVDAGYPAYGAGGVNGYLENHEFERPAVVLSAIGARCGKCFLAEEKWASLANTQLIFPDPSIADVRFLWYQLNDESSWHRSGTAQPFIKPSDVKQRLVILPPLEEQRRVARLLDSASYVMTRRRETMSLTNVLVGAIFWEMFVRDRPGNVVSIGSVAAPTPNAVRTGPFGSQLLHSEFVDEGVAVLGIDNAVKDRFEWGRPRFIAPKKFEQLRRYQVHPGDVLVTIMATCGRVAVVPEDIPPAINTKHLCCITLDHSRCIPTYLWAALRFDSALRRQLGATARGAVMPGLNMSLIKEATVALPPISEQQEFAARVRRVDAQNRLLEMSASALESLFASLRQRALLGGEL